MRPLLLDALAWISLIVACACAALILVDVLRRPQKMGIMNWVWPVTALYGGPLAVWAYLKLGRPDARGAPETPPKLFWQSVVVSASHCGAGCTLGDIIAEIIVAAFALQIAGSMLGAEFALDFAFAYVLGIAFQYFAIVPMRGLSFWPGIWAAVKADTFSLIAFEIGLFGWMALTYYVLFTPRLMPSEPAYWFMMQIGMLIGFATSYPMNVLLIRWGVKEPM